MKNLTEYIQLYENGLLFSFYQEWAIEESLKNSWLNIINEQYGVYNGQMQLLSDIAKDILKNRKEKQEFCFRYDKLKNYKNIFFEELIIKIAKSDTGYLSSYSKYNEKTKLFNKVIIDINYGDMMFSNYKSLLKILVHEITHAWQDYNMKIKGKTLDDFILDNHPYQKNKYKITTNNIEEIAKDIIYTIESFEINGFLSELAVVLEDDFDEYLDNIKNNNEKINKIISYKDAYDMFIKSDIYIRYKNNYDNLINIKYAPKQTQQIFVNYYNENKETNLTFNKIFKILSNKFAKIFEKINTNVPKLYYQYYQKQQKTNLNEGVFDNFSKFKLKQEFDKFLESYESNFS